MDYAALKGTPHVLLTDLAAAFDLGVHQWEAQDLDEQAALQPSNLEEAFLASVVDELD